MDFFKNILNSLSSFTLYKLLPALFILVIGILVVKLINRILAKAFARSKLEKAAVSLVCSVIRIVLLLLVCLIAASALGIDVTGVVALASVLTLALSLSVQDALTNLIGGFTLLYTKPFQIDDYVEIDGQAGTVKQIGLTYTKLLSPDLKTISIPNSSVVSTQIINFTVEGTRRVDININVSYDSDMELVIEALKDAAKVPTALDAPAPYAAVTAFHDSTIGYILQVWTNASTYMSTLHTVNKNIRTIFQERGIILTYPHLNVHLDK